MDVKYNFSIIIPHKNTPDLLRKCLDSIPVRDDVQIIVVDDNSDADKVDFERFPGLNEDRTEVYFTKEGKGAGYARNVGLKHAVGSWIVFADADDYFYDSLNEIFNNCLLLPEDAELVFFKADSINLKDGSQGYRADGLNERIDIAINTHNYQPSLFYSSPWCKVFKSNLLKSNDIWFNEVPCGNDVVFMAKVARFANVFRSFDITAYCITCSDTSITAQKTSTSEEIRLQQDIIGLKIYKERYKLTHTDKYWYFHTWYNLYRKSPEKASVYFGKMLYLLGGSFLYNFGKELLKNFKS